MLINLLISITKIYKFFISHFYKDFLDIYKKEAPRERRFLSAWRRAFACRSACGFSFRFCSFFEWW
jgi:hypothetical protein